MLGEFEETVEKAVYPMLSQVARQGKGEECRQRLSAHGGDVAQATYEAAAADDFGRMPIAAEVNIFEAEISGDQQFVTGGDAQNRAIIADACQDSPVSPAGGATDAGDQRLFG